MRFSLLLPVALLALSGCVSVTRSRAGDHNGHCPRTCRRSCTDLYAAPSCNGYHHDHDKTLGQLTANGHAGLSQLAAFL